MPESEVLKIVLNNGFMALFAVWVLFRGEPKYRETVTTLNSKNAALIKAMSEDFRNTITAMALAHQTALTTVSKEFKEMLVSQQKECREERTEMTMRAVAAQLRDSDLRHKQGELFQKAVADLWEVVGAQPKKPGGPNVAGS